MLQSLKPIVLSLFFVLAFSGCKFEAAESTTQSSFDNVDLGNPFGAGTDSLDPRDENPNLKGRFRPGLVRQSQILQAYAKCMHLPIASMSTSTKTFYRELQGNLSENGEISGLSAPVMMAVTELAGQVCHDLVTRESGMGSSAYFPGFDLSGPDRSGSGDIKPAIKKMAESCWGRKISSLEQQDIAMKYQNTILANNRGTRGALFLCTAIMAMPDVIIY